MSNGDLNGLYMSLDVSPIGLIVQYLIEFATSGCRYHERSNSGTGRRVVDARPLPDDIVECSCQICATDSDSKSISSDFCATTRMSSAAKSGQSEFLVGVLYTSVHRQLRRDA